ncbi:ankyrin-1 isoform X3 [Eurytemora carolleeae]|uniref:ankyrin-1 isoform X3 n=1 Tax=Eurytemora carolleeae TaxID=1294199 RepID=UPI000C78A7D6|nr:ankyrin-1 isoform X3 [Eurytemora carolleeae]|eukprot:XP_023347102.1 ankyrin-1-like isoform X3 [Eurytemora affinis]
MPFYMPTSGTRKLTTIKTSYGCPKWFDAVYNADLEYIKKHSKNVHKKDDLGYTALHHAAIAGNVDVVSLLLEQGEAVDAKGQDGATPLRCAVQEGHTRVVAVLLSRGGSVQDKDEDELTLLHCAADAGHEPIARLLLSTAPHLANLQSRSGWTPLHSAAVMGHPHIVNLLLEYSGNIRLLNNQGKTCLDIAKDRNKTEVIQILERWDHQSQVRSSSMDQTESSIHQSQAQYSGSSSSERDENSLELLSQPMPSKESKESLRRSLVRRVLECPVCLEVMINKKILQCKNGHNVCDSCRFQLLTCPQCRVEYSEMEVRNRGLEELANSK